MSRLLVAPIVEGRGEVESIRTLRDRVWRELLGGEWIHVVRPIRRPRGKRVKSEGHCPGELGPKRLGTAKRVDSRVDVVCVLANVEYETWFAAAADSLTKDLDLTSDPGAPETAEELRPGKAWVEKRFRGTKYSKTLDQAAMTSAMDLAAGRQRAPAFDKLCRELERRLRRPLPSV